jgi:hypothetical protein
MCLALALVAAATSWPRAQAGAGQKPPDAKPAATAGDAQKPAEPAQELPEDAKAFNAAAGEKNPLKRVEALEKFIADTRSPMLLARPEARSPRVRWPRSRTPASLALAEGHRRRRGADTMPLYFTPFASALVTAGIFEEAEEYAGRARRHGRRALWNRASNDERSLQPREDDGLSRRNRVRDAGQPFGRWHPAAASAACRRLLLHANLRLLRLPRRTTGSR